MPEVSTDTEEAIYLKVIEICKLQAKIAVLPGYNWTNIPAKTTTQPPIGTSLTEENAIGNTTNLAVNGLTVPSPAPQVKRHNSLNALYNSNGQLKYTTSIFETLSKEYHPDLTNLFNLMPSSKSKGIAYL